MPNGGDPEKCALAQLFLNEIAFLTLPALLAIGRTTIYKRYKSIKEGGRFDSARCGIF